MQNGDDTRRAAPPENGDKQDIAKPENEVELTNRLSRLGETLATRKAKYQASAKVGSGVYSPGMAKALTLGTEFIGAILFGSAVGLGFDYLLGSRPLFLILFLLLGFAAGVFIVIRGAARLTALGAKDETSEKSDKGHKAE